MNKNYLIAGVVGALVLIGGGAALTMRGDGGVTAMPQMMGMLFNAECRYQDAELCKFMNNWKQPTEYSMHSVMSSKSTPTMEFTSMIKGEDSHTIMSESGKVTYDMITLAGADYMKDLKDEQWWKITKEKASPIPEDLGKVEYDFTEKMTEVEDKTTYVRIGMEACGSSQCYKYQIVDPENQTTKEFIWFDNKDYLMRKMRSEEVGGDMAISEIETKYEKVNITAPSPVKEGSALDVYGAQSGMSKAEIEQLKKDQAQMEKDMAEYMKTMEDGGMMPTE